MVLPIFPNGSTQITSVLSFEKRDGRVTYFHGVMPVFMHDEDDVKSFQMITAQFCANGNTKQTQIAAAFGVTAISVKRAVKLYRKKGAAGFFEPRRTRGAAVLTGPVVAQAQEKLDDGLTPSEVADELDIKRNTFQKAIRAGRLHYVEKKRPISR